VGTVSGPGGQQISYQLFVAPALLASAAMNGAIAEGTFNFFFKLRYNKTFDAILSTPLSAGDVAVGELLWALIRGGSYAVWCLLPSRAVGHLECVLLVHIVYLAIMGIGGLWIVSRRLDKLLLK